MTMEAIYDTKFNIQQALPTKPDYVYSMKLGIIDANVMTRHTKLSIAQKVLSDLLHLRNMSKYPYFSRSHDM
jgi:hypothetical protein